MIFACRFPQRRSRKAAKSRLTHVAEICESRLLLSAVGNSIVISLDAETSISSEADDDLANWRHGVRQQLIKQADEWYGSLFSQTQNRPRWGNYWACGDFAVTFSTMGEMQIAVTRANNLAVSDTNVQVNGVDEADIVETDGEYLYIISGNQLSIVRAGGVDGTSLVSQTTLDGRATAMFLNGNRLTVLTLPQSPNYYSGSIRAGAWLTTGSLMMLDQWQPPSVTATVFDLSDRSAPAVVQESLIDGSYVDARQIGDELIIVVRNDGTSATPPSLNWTITESQETPRPVEDPVIAPAPESDGVGEIRLVQDVRLIDPWGLWPEDVVTYESRDEYLARVDALVSELYPPSVYQRSGSGDGLQESMNWLSEAAVGQSMLSVVRINTAGDGSETPDTISVPSNGWNTVVYVTETSVYLASSESVMVPIDSTVEPLVIDNERNPAAIAQVVRAVDFEYHTVTSIRRIDLTSADLTLAASGQIDGTVSDQHSMDEHNGMLRVAVSQDRGWLNGGSATAIYVLQESGGVLSTIGKIEGMAPGEQLYSARFDGDRAWIVTFRRVDPLFAIDLSDPANPVVTGELKISGYSDYMQSIDENHVIGIGWDADPATGRVTDLQISVFDVTDASDPKLLHRYAFDVSGYEWTEATGDHHAFHWMAEEGLLAIPLASDSSSIDADGQWHYQHSESLAVLKISVEDGISLKGMVSQQGDVRRSLQVEGFLYSVSDKSVAVIRIDDPDEILAEVELGDGSYGPFSAGDLLRQRDLFRSLPPAEGAFEKPVDGDQKEKPDELPTDEIPSVGDESDGNPDSESVSQQVIRTAVGSYEPVAEFDPAVFETTVDPSPADESRLIATPARSAIATAVDPVQLNNQQRSFFRSAFDDIRIVGFSSERKRELNEALPSGTITEPELNLSLSDDLVSRPSHRKRSGSSDTESGISGTLQIDLNSTLNEEPSASKSDVNPQEPVADEFVPDIVAPEPPEPQVTAESRSIRFGNVAFASQQHQKQNTNSRLPASKLTGSDSHSSRIAGAAEIDEVMGELAQTGV